jgi:CHAT domain-containing protein/tetratricopeptide (TPR) repeat protein
MVSVSETAVGRRRNNELHLRRIFPLWACGALLAAAALAARPPSPAPPAAGSLDRALALYRQGRLPEALQAYRTLAAASADPAPEGVTAVIAEARHNLCAIENELGDYRAALPDCREALRLRRAEGGAGDAGNADAMANLGQALNNLGLALEMLGSTAEAESSYKEALELNRRRGDFEGEAINLGNLGALAASTGRYSEALALHAAAADLARRHRGAPWAAEQLRVANINQGTVLGKLGAYREALDLYRGMLAATSEPRDRAALLVNTGVLYRNLGDPLRAADAFKEAIAAYTRLADTASLSNAWLNLGLAQHKNLAEPAAAERSFREALRLATASGDRTEEVQDLFYLGRLLADRGRLDEAAALFGRGLAAAEASGAAEGKWSCREGLGRVAAARGEPVQALAQLDRALAEIERVRAGISRGARRAGYFGSKRSVYAATVGVLAELERREPGRGWSERALDVVERAKARDLLDALGGGAFDGRGRGASPRTAAELRRRAGDGTVLEYFLGETDLYLWVIRKDGIQMTDLGPHAPLLAAAARVHRALAHGADPPPADLAELSRTLLGPAAPLPASAGAGAGATLRIAADGPLRYLPFELLADPASPGTASAASATSAASAATPLVDRLAIVYLPSASMLADPAAARRSDRRPAALDLAGFGDPVLRPPGATTVETPAPTPRDLLLERFGLARLPATSGELRAVARALGGRDGRHRLFTGAAATESAFRAAVIHGARVVHLATHTVIDERPGRGAAILLTPEGRDDGLLTPEEIAKLDDRADLTVLAACRSALDSQNGENAGADGGALASLTGAFLAAGSRGVVATLWDVDDAATAAFMAQLYDRLGRGDPPALALRRAKLRLRADPRWNHPALWAGYILVGEAPPVVSGWRRWSREAGLAGGAAIAAIAAVAGVTAIAAVVIALRLRRRRRLSGS